MLWLSISKTPSAKLGRLRETQSQAKRNRRKEGKRREASSTLLQTRRASTDRASVLAKMICSQVRPRAPVTPGLRRQGDDCKFQGSQG